ncbi:MAG: glycosyltransferase [Candidatus Abyssobacteria bacterium SURF_5]|uniref:Glycosyltransferase n=1 Tax=Abyssobacteria bacterium (strain SURF_5) TaxID=2093360 RepID=A0A3A4NYA8_ABYX5|nr:MAG: glycosyltransferase [Candidatus Abyssubacteria bacterium SURF_5]
MSQKFAPTVSVVMGVYNGARFLREAIHSVLDQTFGDFEFIIIDDGSTDETAEILHGFSDPRVRILTHEKNEGLTRSLIRGCSEARGKYVARMDADDISHLDRFSMQVEFLEENPEYTVAGTQFHFIDAFGRKRQVSSMPRLEEEVREAIERAHSPVAHGSAMFVRERILGCGGYREMFRYAQDFDLWLRVLERYRITNLPEILYGLRFHGLSATRRHYYLQCRFVEMARRFAKMRAENGLDPLMRGDIESVRAEIESWKPEGFIQASRMRSETALRLAEVWVDWVRLSDIFRLWVLAAINDPANKDVWKFLASRRFRSRLARTARGRLKRRSRNANHESFTGRS